MLSYPGAVLSYPGAVLSYPGAVEQEVQERDISFGRKGLIVD